MKDKKRTERREVWATVALISGVYLVSMDAEPWWFGVILRLAGVLWLIVAVRWLVRG